MNYQDLIPYLGGIVPGMMSPGKMDIDPSMLMIGGMMPGILNMSTGGTNNLSKAANSVGLLNNNDFGFGQTSTSINPALLQLILSKYMGG